MWYGVTAAVALSIGVGVTLKVVEQNLPQRQQEGMETVIGLVAVVFVTAMVLWMTTHARFMKRDLEGAAEKALSNGDPVLAGDGVPRGAPRGLRDLGLPAGDVPGRSSTASAFVGAVLGILAAIAWATRCSPAACGINLGRFFTVTSVFLILVAAGLVLSALRTGHEAGWVTIGRGAPSTSSWLAPTGSIRAALISGVLGIPADPRVVELLGWACYLVPMLALILWPRRLRPSAETMPRCVWRVPGSRVAAAALVLVVPAAARRRAPSAPARRRRYRRGRRADGHDATSLCGPDRSPLVRTTREGPCGAQSWTAPARGVEGAAPRRLTLTQLLRYTGQRVPVGLDRHPQPRAYAARWSDRTTSPRRRTTAGSSRRPAGASWC